MERPGVQVPFLYWAEPHFFFAQPVQPLHPHPHPPFFFFAVRTAKTAHAAMASRIKTAIIPALLSAQTSRISAYTANAHSHATQH